MAPFISFKTTPLMGKLFAVEHVAPSLLQEIEIVELGEEAGVEINIGQVEEIFAIGRGLAPDSGCTY
jgi:hypothetical protein